MRKQYKRLIHKVLEGGKIMSSRQIHDAIIDLPSFENSGSNRPHRTKKRVVIPNYTVLVGMLANGKYGCIRVNDKKQHPALWKLKEE
tara:strand:+ start:420 stop:680 length:261 start_codon:yes stop_codon:yes gene_type:complete